MMSSLSRHRSRKFKSDINIVPYVDVMMVLLVIFMVAAPMVAPQVIQLPSAGAVASPPMQYIEVTLLAKGGNKLQIQGKAPSQHQILTVKTDAELIQQLTALHQAFPDLPVMILADKDLRYQQVIQVITDAKAIGIARVGLATQIK